MSVSYISKVENERLHFGDFPSVKFIHKLAGELKTDEDELLLRMRMPDALRQRIRERPDVFNAVADLDNKSMDRLLQHIFGIEQVRSHPARGGGESRLYQPDSNRKTPSTPNGLEDELQSRFEDTFLRFQR